MNINKEYILINISINIYKEYLNCYSLLQIISEKKK